MEDLFFFRSASLRHSDAGRFELGQQWTVVGAKTPRLPSGIRRADRRVGSSGLCHLGGIWEQQLAGTALLSGAILAVVCFTFRINGCEQFGDRRYVSVHLGRNSWARSL